MFESLIFCNICQLHSLSYLYFTAFCICFDLPNFSHSTAEFYQNSPHFCKQNKDEIGCQMWFSNTVFPSIQDNSCQSPPFFANCLRTWEVFCLCWKWCQSVPAAAATEEDPSSMSSLLSFPLLFLVACKKSCADKWVERRHILQRRNCESRIFFFSATAAAAAASEAALHAAQTNKYLAANSLSNKAAFHTDIEEDYYWCCCYWPCSSYRI